MPLIARRSFLAGIGAVLAAPAIVRAGSLMPVRALDRLAAPAAWSVVRDEVGRIVGMSPMTATEVLERMRLAQLELAHKLSNPPLFLDSAVFDRLVRAPMNDLAELRSMSSVFP